MGIIKYSDNTINAPINPVSSAITENIKSVCGSGEI